MNKQIKIAHIALQYHDKKEAETFFCGILGLNKEKEFTIPADMADSIFGIGKDVDVVVYSNKNARFEIFFTEERPKIVYEHICINVESREEIINLCKKYGVEINNVKKESKELLFIRDFNGYIYEIKEIKDRGK